MKKLLALSDKLRVPLEIVTSKTTILGMTGSGKSWLMFKLAELFLAHSVQTIFLDPKGEAWGLRLAADGKSPAYPIPVFGGDKADMPLRPDMGRRMAELLVEGDYSAILDVSAFISSELAHFGYDFATRLFELKKRKPGAMSLMIDEAQDFIPQNPSERGMETKMLGAFERVGKQLRSKGVGMVLAGQRPQEINKKVINMSEFWFAFQMTGIQERDTLEKLVKDKDKDEAARLTQVLPTLEVGVAHVWSPRVLQISAEFKIGARETFDSSATPEVGARRVVVRKLAPVDAHSLSKAMEDIVAEEKAKDPATLLDVIGQQKKQIRDLEKAIAAKPGTPAPAKPKIEIKKVPAIKDSQLAKMDSLITRATAVAHTFGEVETHLVVLEGRIADIAKRMREEIAEVRQAAYGSITAAREAMNGQPAPDAKVFAEFGAARVPAQSWEAGKDEIREVQLGVTKPPETAINPVTSVLDNGGPTAPQKGIVQAIALLEDSSLPDPTLPIVAIVKGVSHTTGSFQQDVRRLAAGGFIARLPDGSKVRTTPAGRVLIERMAPLCDPIKSEDELHAMLLDRLGRLSKPRADILRVVMDFYPGRMQRPNIAKTLGKSHTTGSFQDDCRKLRRAGLLTFEDGSTLRAADVLYPISARRT